MSTCVACSGTGKRRSICLDCSLGRDSNGDQCIWCWGSGYTDEDCIFCWGRGNTDDD